MNFENDWFVWKSICELVSGVGCCCDLLFFCIISVCKSSYIYVIKVIFNFVGGYLWYIDMW